MARADYRPAGKSVPGWGTSVPGICMYFLKDQLLKMSHCNVYLKFPAEGRSSLEVFFFFFK